ncbi:MAG: threonine/serine exporter family protein [Candidatus Amulumruptor caecigallinarius]|nr:threonine/serine exporter family protein [Candidatus Amulumruptor caecigallinarius]MCM1396243.1 threonine/serine exporter family protein [Candidatus Amulumruptor caecigallinarius]MCM1453757.1 threonine/serine exporter family protein [bacterium]
MLGSGVSTLRVIRCTKRIGEAFGLNIEMTSTARHFTLSVRDSLSCKSVTRVVSVPPLPISFHLNADLSTLSWQAYDECLSLDEVRARFKKLTSKQRLDPMLTLLLVSLANACFCALFGGDLTAMIIVFVATLIGFGVRQRMAMHGVNQYLVFMASAFVASMCSTMALRFDCTAHIAIATSPLFLIPGVPLINGVIDIVDNHILVGISRLVNAMLLILCLAIGLSATMLIAKSSLL